MSYLCITSLIVTVFCFTESVRVNSGYFPNGLGGSDYAGYQQPITANIGPFSQNQYQYYPGASQYYSPGASQYYSPGGSQYNTYSPSGSQYNTYSPGISQYNTYSPGTPQLYSPGIAPLYSPIHHQPQVYQNQELNNVYKDAKKQNVGNYDNVYQVNQDQKHFGEENNHNGQVAVKEGTGNSGYYNNVNNGKKQYEDGKEYYNGQQFKQGGLNEAQRKLNQGHKKGSKTKGFKTSHHKDETGKTEEFFDEYNDEGDNLNFDGQSGYFDKSGANSVKGGHLDHDFIDNSHKKQGSYNNEEYLNKNNANHGKFHKNDYLGRGHQHGRTGGVDEESLLDSQEYTGVYKHVPHAPYSVPFARY